MSCTAIPVHATFRVQVIQCNSNFRYVDASDLSINIVDQQLSTKWIRTQPGFVVYKSYLFLKLNNAFEQ